MPLPIVAIVGRPNVGKSTLVNRIVQGDEAIVHAMRGVTRDRSYHKADWCGTGFILVDTGGIEISTDDAFQGSIRRQALQAAESADAVIFVVDGRCGINEDDEKIARILHRGKAPAFLAVNKMDTPGRDGAIWEFLRLGLGDPWAISATHGHGTGDLLDAVCDGLKKLDYDFEEEKNDINVAIIGRPNAGKSSLTNRLAGSERSIVSDTAGTTRDAVDTLINRNGKTYRLVDTAGLRRKSQIDADVEYYGFVRAMRAIERADVALLVIDGSLGLTNEDQRVASYAAERGCAMAIILNKWDLIDGPEKKAKIREHLDDRMAFIAYAPRLAVSAATGKGTGRIWDVIDRSYANFCSHIPTSRLNSWLFDIREEGHTVTKGRAVLRMKYMTQTSARPPQYTVFCNRPDIVTDNYRRFLENRLRKNFDLCGTPIRMKFRKKD